MLKNEIISNQKEKYIKYANECNEVMNLMKFNKTKFTENHCLTNVDLNNKNEDKKMQIYKLLINRVEKLFLLELSSFNIEISNIMEDNNNDIFISDIFSYIIKENTINTFDINHFIDMLNIKEIINNKENLIIEELILILQQNEIIINTKLELDSMSVLNQLFKLNANEYYYSQYHYIDNKTSIIKSTKPNEQNAIYFDSGMIY